MEASVKIIKNLQGEFVEAAQVKEATQKEYNQAIWNDTVNRYSKYEDVRFFKTPGSIYKYDYYVIYIADGVRFLGEVSYSNCLSNGSFAYGFYTEGIKDKDILEKMKDIPGFENFGKDSITILVHSGGRINISKEARDYMRKETEGLATRFFTKQF